MIRVLVAILVLGSVGMPAYSQVAVVRSGEHDGFTRLVLPLPVDASWTIDRANRAFSVEVNAPDIQFDFSRVFDRIPRSRLVSMAQEKPGSKLVFSLGCTCSVSSFMDTPGFLVIDIADEVSTTEDRPEKIERPIIQTRYRLPSQMTSPVRPAQRAFALPVRALALPITVGKGPLPEALPAGEPTAPALGWSNGRPSAINLSEQRLLAQISRATGQGLLELASKPKPTNTEPGADGAQDQDARNEAQGWPVSASLSVTTAIDRDLVLITDSLGQSSSDPKCLEQARVDLSNWGGDKPFSADISRWRSELFGEFDNLNSQAVLGLVRAYLYYGFGVEAVQVMGLEPDSKAERGVLMALAQLLETGSLPGDNPFADQQNCDGDVALWSVLSVDSAPENTNSEAVLRAFSRLPYHLRSYLGPKISQRFSMAGDSQVAGSILRAITRSGTESGTEIELAKAAVAALQGDTETVEQELTKSVVAGSEYSPEALVKLVANWFESREILAPDLPDLAAAYASEYRDTEIGADLRRTHVVTLALAGKFGEAFDLLPELAKRDGDPKKQMALDPLLQLLTERANDVDFLRFSLGTASDGLAQVPDQVADGLARRLLDLGFPEQAAFWIDTSEGYAGSNTRRAMRGEIALARQQPHRALVELAGLPGLQATRLRATATSQIGNFNQAGLMLNSVGDFDGAARGFWLGENWETAPEREDTFYSQVIANSVQLRPADADPEVLTPLAQARSLMQVSSETRGEISELLQKVLVERP